MKTVEFKIQAKWNKDIYQVGYVELPDEEDEDVEWFYDDQNGFAIPNEFTHHDGIGLTQIGATEEQISEIDRFLELVRVDLVDWVQDVIIFSEEDENATYHRGDLIIIINDGAKMELVCETDYDPNDNPFGDRNFYALLSFKYNRETIKWDEDTFELWADDIDSTYCGEDKYTIIDSRTMEIEINDEFDEELNEYVGLSGLNESSRELIKDHLEDAQKRFQSMLFDKVRKETGFEDDVFERSVNSDLMEQGELFDLYLWSKGDLTAEQFADRNGYEWEF